MYYTNIHNLQDGFGESLKFILFSIFYVEWKGGIFHYTPFQPTLAHNYDQDPLFLRKKEDLMRFSFLFPRANPTEFFYEPLSKFDLIHFFELNADNIFKYSRSFLNLKNVFFQERQRPRVQPYVAIHIRRMNNPVDSQQNKMIEGCEVPDELYQKLCFFLHKTFPQIEIHIFSQGEKEDFHLVDIPIFWRLNEPIETTFLEMTFADILVIAPSAFSYTAALYSKSQEIWYVKSCLRPLAHWKPILGYESTKNAYVFKTQTSDGKKDIIIFDPKRNQFFLKDSGEEFFF